MRGLLEHARAVLLQQRPASRIRVHDGAALSHHESGRGHVLAEAQIIGTYQKQKAK